MQKAKIPTPQSAPSNPLKEAKEAGNAGAGSASKPEEQKRAKWGNNNAGPRSNSKGPGAQEAPKPQVYLKPSGGGNAGGAIPKNPSQAKLVQGRKASYNNEDEVSSPDNKKKKQDDWNYLKQTLKSNNMMNGGAANNEGE